MITDKLASYAVAKRVVMPGGEHPQHKGLNKRAENSHQPTRQRERIMEALQVSRAGPGLSLGPRSGGKYLPPSCQQQRR
jgi:putative transposase